MTFAGEFLEEVEIHDFMGECFLYGVRVNDIRFPADPDNPELFSKKYGPGRWERTFTAEVPAMMPTLTLSFFFRAIHPDNYWLFEISWDDYVS